MSMRVPRHIGPYVVEEALGRGSQGKVWRGRCRVTGRLVAIKVSHGRLASAALERVYREFELSRQVDDPCVPQARHIGTLDDGRTYVISDFVEGTHLWRWRHTLGPVGSPSRCQRVGHRMAQLARILARVHTRGVIHADLKLSAAMVDHTAPELRLLDFGGAVSVDAPAPKRYFGTARYSSPEQLSREKLTPASDIWSFGVIGTLLWSGEWPLSGPRVKVQRKLQRDPELVQRALEDVDPDGTLGQVLRRCVQMVAWSRPDAAWVADTLESAFGSHTWSAVSGLDPVAMSRARAVLADATPGGLLALTCDHRDTLDRALAVLRQDVGQLPADYQFQDARDLTPTQRRRLSNRLESSAEEGAAFVVVLYGTVGDIAEHVLKSKRLEHVELAPQASTGAIHAEADVPSVPLPDAIVAARKELEAVTLSVVEREIGAARAALSAGDHSRAVAHAQTAFVTMPQSPSALRVMAEVLLELERWEQLRQVVITAAETPGANKAVVRGVWHQLEQAEPLPERPESVEP